MPLTGDRTFLGFGFGAIQAGLFLYEAQRSGNFGRLVVAEVLPDVVADTRRAGGRFYVNIAHDDRIERAHLGPIEIENPGVDADRERLVEAAAAAHEIATAIPSVSFYQTAGPGSLHRILAEGFARKVQDGPPCVVYAAENNNHAAELLEAAVMSEMAPSVRDAVNARVQFLNTVIGKMSGVVIDAVEIREQGLAPTTPDGERAFRVEAFNRILISRITFSAADHFQRGLAIFEEKDDLLPFEEAKLYGHNAVHALAAYLGALVGAEYVSELRAKPGLMALLREAFIAESGAALTRKYSGLDPLFTPAGYAAYADDLLARMTNPYLRDAVERVGRDPRRKLGWEDRLVGTMRVCLAQGVQPARFGMGAAAALCALEPGLLHAPPRAEATLDEIWRQHQPDPTERAQIIRLIMAGLRRIEDWEQRGYQDGAIWA